MSNHLDAMRYIEFDIKNPRCIHCYISDRAYASVITEVMTNGENETGGVFLGYIIKNAWYIVESVDPGIDTINQVAFFKWDTNYVNHQAKRLSKIYKRPMTVLGFWHRHPGSMDYFSGQDESTIRSNLRELRVGLLSMLVNIDPRLRMTFYYCYDNEIMPIRYDVGNKYFPQELLKFADADELSKRASAAGKPMEIFYQQVIDFDTIVARRKGLTQINKEDSPVQIKGSSVAIENTSKNMFSSEKNSLSKEEIYTIIDTVSKNQNSAMKSSLDQIVAEIQDIRNCLSQLTITKDANVLSEKTSDTSLDIQSDEIVKLISLVVKTTIENVKMNSSMKEQNAIVNDEAETKKGYEEV